MKIAKRKQQQHDCNEPPRSHINELIFDIQIILQYHNHYYLHGPKINSKTD